MVFSLDILNTWQLASHADEATLIRTIYPAVRWEENDTGLPKWLAIEPNAPVSVKLRPFPQPRALSGDWTFEVSKNC